MAWRDSGCLWVVNIFIEYFFTTKSSVFVFVFLNTSRRETSSGNHSDKWRIICAATKQGGMQWKLTKFSRARNFKVCQSVLKFLAKRTYVTHSKHCESTQRNKMEAKRKQRNPSQTKNICATWKSNVTQCKKRTRSETENVTRSNVVERARRYPVFKIQ